MSEIVNFISQNSSWVKSRALMFVRGNSEEAEDLAQDVLLKMWLYRRKYIEGTDIKAWAARILKNTYIDRYKKFKNKKHCSLAFEDNNSEENHYNFYPDYSEDNKAYKNILLEEVQIHIDKLNSEEKTFFSLYLKGVQYDELADIFEIPIGTVKNRIFSIKEGLKYKMNPRKKVNHGFIYS